MPKQAVNSHWKWIKDGGRNRNKYIISQAGPMYGGQVNLTPLWQGCRQMGRGEYADIDHGLLIGEQIVFAGGQSYKTTA